MIVHLEMTRQVGDNAPISIVGTGLATIAMFVVLGDYVPQHILVFWFSAQVLLLGARFYFAAVFKRFDSESEEWSAAVANFTRAMFVIGLGWGGAAILAGLYGTLLDQVVVLAILLGVVGAAIGTVAQILSAYTVFLISAMVPQVFSFLVLGEQPNLLLGLLTIVYCMVVYRAGHNLAANIRDLVEVREHLASAKLAADEANLAKSQFLSRMSHELRTPLNAIIGFSQIQERYFDEATPPKLRQSREHILLAGKHLLTLVEDILDIVKIEQHTLDMPLDSVDLNSVIETSLSLVQVQAEKLQISLNYEPSNLTVLANFHRLTQILVNLLSNAIKYNNEGGSVTLSIKAPTQEQVVIVVEDTGVGLDPNDMEKIFAPFSRLTYATQNQIDGTGIGLALSKFLIERMNGSIGFDQAPEQGAIFWIKLPLGKTLKNEPIRENKPAKVSPQATSSVLYIEDNAASRELLQMMLNHQYPNLQIFTASDAEEGLEIARRIRPDAIFVDINLPGMDGISALKIMKNDPALAGTKMIALSADAMPQQIETAMDAGFDQYMTKPIEFEKLIKIIEEL